MWAVDAGQTPVTAAAFQGSVDPEPRPVLPRQPTPLRRLPINGVSGISPAAVFYRDRPVSCRKQFRFAAKCEINNSPGFDFCMRDAICVPLNALGLLRCRQHRRPSEIFEVRKTEQTTRLGPLEE